MAVRRTHNPRDTSMPKTPSPSVASASSGSGGAFVLADVLDFLEKRHFNVPAALRKACPSKPPLERRTASSLKALESVEFKWALTLLSELKERERRALARFVEKRASGGSNTAGGAAMAHAASTPPLAISYDPTARHCHIDLRSAIGGCR